jgi:hypothetical protein
MVCSQHCRTPIGLAEKECLVRVFVALSLSYDGLGGFGGFIAVIFDFSVLSNFEDMFSGDAQTMDCAAVV